MSKQTAVEWLIKKLQNREKGIFDGLPHLSLDEIYKQAKEMEKQHSIEFARHCLEKANRTFDLDILTSFIDVHQYYNEEYGKQ